MAPSRGDAPTPSGEGDATSFIRRAEELNDSGDYQTALELLERAIASDPRNADAFVARGWAMENLGPDHAPEARAAYEKAIALDPSNPWGRQGLAHILETDGELVAARTLYRSVVTEYGDDENADPELLEIVGWCRYRLGETEAAERTFRSALEVEPNLASVRFDLALTLFALGRGKEALAEIETALRGLEASGLGRRRAAIQVAVDDLQRAMLTDESLGGIREAGRAKVALEAALESLPEP